jgi:N6-adenosine-specific RNA methylase IME4
MDARTLAKQERRAKLEAELAAKILALPGKRYGVLLADPGWRFEPYSRTTGMDRAADNHYVTEVLAKIMALDVASIAAPDSVLFLWITNPMLPQGLAVMARWGFTYKTNFAWAKDRLGTGYWSRNQHELLLVGTRGRIPAPAPGTQWSSLIVAPRRAHSQKPDAVYELVERYYPNLPKLEMFCRGEGREGWSVWGAEAIQPNVTEVAA